MTANDALAFLHHLASIAHPQEVHFLWRPFLRDPDDDMVVECAVAAGARYVVTHSLRDVKKRQLGVYAVPPSDFLALLRSAA